MEKGILQELDMQTLGSSSGEETVLAEATRNIEQSPFC